MQIPCRNCGTRCTYVEFIDTPFCCISCEEEFEVKLAKKRLKN